MRILRTPYRALPSVPIRQADRLPTTNGLYYVVDGWHLLYVGKATGFRRRWRSDDKNAITAEYSNARIHYRQRPKWRLSTDEAFEVQRLRPSRNIQRPKPGNFPIANFFAWSIDILHCAGVLLGVGAIGHLGWSNRATVGEAIKAPSTRSHQTRFPTPIASKYRHHVSPR